MDIPEKFFEEHPRCRYCLVQMMCLRVVQYSHHVPFMYLLVERKDSGVICGEDCLIGSAYYISGKELRKVGFKREPGKKWIIPDTESR